MSCGIAVGLALTDLVIFMIATNATAIAVGKGVQAGMEAAERRRLREMIREAAGEQFAVDELLDESAEEEVQRLLEASGSGPDFDDAEVIVRTGAGDLIGLRRDSEGIYQVIAKWRPDDAQRLQVDSSDVAEKWRQRYAYLKVKREAEALGYEVVEEQILPDESIRVRVRRWD